MKEKQAIRRLLPCPEESFFLFGPRGVGKSTWLSQVLPGVRTINFLNHAEFLALHTDPSLLASKLGQLKNGDWVCLDEVQKVPEILDEVHRLIEEKGYRFALSGSSARKLKRGGANLLGGRAVTRHLGCFSLAELQNRFDLVRALEWGLLPLVFLNPSREADLLSSYVFTYLREEIQAEGLVRQTEPFARFLEIAGLLNSQQVNVQNISRDAHVAGSTVETYLSILEDTLLATRLKSYQPQAKVREHTHPKLYWFDAGVARAAAGLLFDPVDSVWLGASLETLILHELTVYNQTANRNRQICYYRTGQDSEIDFVIETRKRTVSQKAHLVCLEIKSAKRWRSEWERPIRSLAATGKLVMDKMIGVYQGTETLTFDKFVVYPVLTFLTKLHAGEIF